MPGNQATGPAGFATETQYDGKPILDEIDRVLARHYGFTEEPARRDPLAHARGYEERKRPEKSIFLTGSRSCGPKRRNRHEPELVAKGHDLVAEIEHYAGAEPPAELFLKQPERRKVRRPNRGARLHLNGRHRAV